VSRRWGRDAAGHDLGSVLDRTPAFRAAPVPPGLPAAWDEVLGAAARHAVLHRLRGGTLSVVAKEPAWTLQIEDMEEAVCGRLRELGFAVHRLEVRGPRTKLR